MLLLVFLILLLNFGISIWNAVAVGNAWVESKHSGGWPRFMTWMGALMSALGFTWCYLIVLVFAAMAFGYLDERAAEAGLYLGYIVVVPGILFSGVMIMIDSWARAYRQRTVANVGVAGYNTFANIYNTYNAIRTIPEAFENVLDFFKSSSKNKDSQSAALVILLVILALFGGVITTWMIVAKVAANDEPLPMQQTRFARR